MSFEEFIDAFSEYGIVKKRSKSHYSLYYYQHRLDLWDNGDCQGAKRYHYVSENIRGDFYDYPELLDTFFPEISILIC